MPLVIVSQFCSKRSFVIHSFKIPGWLKEKKWREPIDYLETETVDFLACDGVGGTRRTSDHVPWRRRSVRLIFQATKAAVCRPFAR
ncbi:MAG: hypothetical protein AAB562_00105 [Patescibacteria group bacterium]